MGGAVKRLSLGHPGIKYQAAWTPGSQGLRLLLHVLGSPQAPTALPCWMRLISSHAQAAG